MFVTVLHHIHDSEGFEAAEQKAFTVGASPMTRVKTVKLLTLDEADAAINRSVGYRPPGS